jgi:hypothetical protein
MRFDRTIAIDAPVLTAVTLLRALLHLPHRGHHR